MCFICWNYELLISGHDSDGSRESALRHFDWIYSLWYVYSPGVDSHNLHLVAPIDNNSTKRKVNAPPKSKRKVTMLKSPSLQPQVGSLNVK